jgi:hypothetical protein
MYTLLYTTVTTGVKLWKNMGLYISGMTVNIKDTTLDVDGEMRMMVMFVHQTG